MILIDKYNVARILHKYLIGINTVIIYQYKYLTKLINKSNTNMIIIRKLKITIIMVKMS